MASFPLCWTEGASPVVTLRTSRLSISRNDKLLEVNKELVLSPMCKQCIMILEENLEHSKPKKKKGLTTTLTQLHLKKLTV